MAKPMYSEKKAGKMPERVNVTYTYRIKEEGKEDRFEFVEIPFEKIQDLRYGDNPHEPATIFAPTDRENLFYIASGNITELKTGKPLSKTNIEDMDRALRIVSMLDDQCVAVMKHVNPSGAAHGGSQHEAYTKARDSDRTSAYGSVVAFNKALDPKTADEIMKTYVECVIAPGFQENALEILKTPKYGAKGNLNEEIRVVCANDNALSVYRERMFRQDPDLKHANQYSPQEIDIKTLADGVMILSAPDKTRIRSFDDMTLVTKAHPTEQQKIDAVFGWRVVPHIRSNGVVFVKDGYTIGVGMGQVERIAAIKNAIARADEKNPGQLKGSVLVSEALIPKPDNIEAIAEKEIGLVVQTGQSTMDDVIIEMCDKFGIPMAMTYERRFSHH